MRLNALTRFAAFCLGVVGLQVAPVAAGETIEPPTTEEAQAAYARFATAFVGRLINAGVPFTLSGSKFAEINELAHRQPLRGCDERRERDPDPFAPADAPPPPIVFNCTWESGERISLTRVPNTGTWVVSDDAIAAAGAGILLVGPKQQTQQVVAVPTAPKKAPELPGVNVPAPPAAVASIAPQAVYSGANLQAMPSPFVPPARAEPVRSSNPTPAGLSPMPTPFANGAR
jgi:hypothetical protein